MILDLLKLVNEGCASAGTQRMLEERLENASEILEVADVQLS